MAVTTMMLQAFGLVLLATSIYTVSYVVYNIFFHPLRHFPGPLLMRATRAAYCYRLVRGTISFDMLDLHRRYGPVVRVAPDELAFSDADAWKVIFGHKVGANAGGGVAGTFEKSDTFYRPIPGLPRDIITALGPQHAALRRQMAHGFSDRALREQQPVIMKYVDLFIQRLKEQAARQSAASIREATPFARKEEQEEPVNLTLWYNYCTFDIIGDLAFGEPFGCLDNSDYHPWVRTVFQMVRVGVAFQTANHYSWLRRIITAALSTEAMHRRREEQREMTMQKVLRRIELGKSGPRSDLVEGLLKKKDEWNMSLDELEANSSILIIAGSETTATVLAGVTYLLLKNPDKMAKLVEEVRTMFASEEEIDLTSVNRLTYMLACLDEALRMYPPVPTGLPREVPKGGATICGQFIPENTIVAIHQWATYHDERNFKNPFKFHPERFLGDPEYATDKREALQPFHLGPRNCLGRNLAYVEMRIMLARMIWNFDLVLADDSQDWMERQMIYVLWAKGALNVYLKPVVRN
ncbi:Cytochrome P450 monooxygenase 1 [Colletotrichum siamense]|uniref:Cytochrome P450 monooxygenase 1 n=1 Tax=Colletotrichum siamense TaxID=690259 RepID=UPI00187225E8|nr:Cytochrome P450 monooxygenase 1 [Colletotrichum siamense]KAF5492575.1 Cytochrome P450 monooxygenase 1 [Colletotrichum siamense]